MMNVAHAPTGKKESAGKRFKRAFQRDKWLYLIILLPALYYIIFCYWPMYGVTLAFKNFKPKLGIFGSPWVGMKYMTQIVNDAYFWTVFKNTIVLNLENLLFSFPAPIILALLLNEVTNRHYKKLVQTVSYLPHFISTVVVVGMLNTMFSSTGIVNQMLNALGVESKAFMVSANYFRPMYIGSNVWSTIGWGSIIYLAALSGLDMELYEAARIDGAGRWQQTLHITIPGILPTIIIMLILEMGKIMNVSYQKILLMMTGSNQSVSDVISTYVYRRGIINGDFEYATGVDLFRSVVSLIFVVATNAISRRVTETSLW